MKASSRATLSPQNITIVHKTEKKRKKIYAEGNKEGGSYYHLWLLQATCSCDGGGSLRSHPSHLFRGHTICTPQCHENYHNMFPPQYWWSWLKCTQHQRWAPEELSILFHVIPTLNAWFPWPSLPLCFPAWALSNQTKEFMLLSFCFFPCGLTIFFSRMLVLFSS